MRQEKSHVNMKQFR